MKMQKMFGFVCLSLCLVCAVVACAQGAQNVQNGGFEKAFAAWLEGDVFLSVNDTDAENPIPYYIAYMQEALGGTFQNVIALKNKYDELMKNPRSLEYYSKNLPLIKQAAAKNRPNAQFLLGRMYAHAIVEEKDLEKAMEWGLKAAEQGHILAQAMVSQAYIDGEGVEQDYVEAMKWARKAADKGYDDAQYLLGQMYQHGVGVEQSETEAFKWFSKAAEKGSPYAQYSLGLCYADGIGVNRDEKQAEVWFRKAAEQGIK